MAVTKAETQRVLREFWKLLPYVELEDGSNNIVLIGTVVSTTQPAADNVVWVQPTDTTN